MDRDKTLLKSFMSLFCFSVVSSAFFFVARKAGFFALVIFKEVDIAHLSLLVSDKTIPCKLAISALLYIIIMTIINLSSRFLPMCCCPAHVVLLVNTNGVGC